MTELPNLHYVIRIVQVLGSKGDPVTVAVDAYPLNFTPMMGAAELRRLYFPFAVESETVQVMPAAQFAEFCVEHGLNVHRSYYRVHNSEYQNLPADRTPCSLCPNYLSVRKTINQTVRKLRVSAAAWVLIALSVFMVLNQLRNEFRFIRMENPKRLLPTDSEMAELRRRADATEQMVLRLLLEQPPFRH